MERTTPDNEKLMEEWEAKLAKSGMPSEPKPDKGRQALEKATELETGRVDDDKRVMQELYSYWLSRGEVSFGHHKTIAQSIEQRMGLPSGTIDESLIKDAEEEVARAQREARKIFQRITI
ncbi:MAG: hypothetical protein AAB664_00010 [Patescibacteria group bacterium]